MEYCNRAVDGTLNRHYFRPDEMFLIYKADTAPAFQAMKDRITIADARSLSPREREGLRKKVVLAVESGWRIGEVADLFGVARQSAGKWVGECREDGAGAPRSRKRGREGGGALFARAKGTGDRRDPRQYPGRGGASVLPVDPEGRGRPRTQDHRSPPLPHDGVTVFEKVGIHPPASEKKAREQDSREVKKWVETEYTAIRDAAERDDAEVFFLDQIGLRSDRLPGRSYGLRGLTPTFRRRESGSARTLFSPCPRTGT